MESTGKWMFLKFAFCVFVFLTAVQSSFQNSAVVNFALEKRYDDALFLKDTEKLTRLKRSSITTSERQDEKCSAQKDTFTKTITNNTRLETMHTFVDETNFNLALAWAGMNDDGTLLVLTSDFAYQLLASSTLWRSTDHGRTWNNISSLVNNHIFRKEDGLQRNPHNPKWAYLISYEHFLYKTEDGGASWEKVNFVATVEDELIFHDDPEYKDHVMVILSGRKLVKTVTNFDTFEVVRDGLVHVAHWGNKASGSHENIFITYGIEFTSFFNIDDSPTVYELQKSNSEGKWDILRKNVIDFGIQGDFLYASVYKDDNPTLDSERQMIVSSDAGKTWNEAQLPTLIGDRFFSVLDMSEHLIFIHVDNPGDTGHGTLYTSSSQGIFYSKSLERHLYPNYNSITDFYKVASMRGSFIASQLNEDKSIHSVITFNLGADWKNLTKPEGIPCSDNSQSCSLQIHSAYSLHRGITTHPPLSTEDAVGIILVNAHVAQSLQTTPPDVFISSDGGYTWRKTLDGPHAYVIADSGALLVAISLSDPNPQTIKFSTDEGHCWHEYQFTNDSIHHTGLLTEPGGKSLTVAMWGYRVADKKWTINVIDFADVLQKICTKDDYEDWIALNTLRREEHKGVDGCLLGTRVTFKRLKADSWCQNGYDYKLESIGTQCPCTIEDFECDYGYFVQDEKCIEQIDFKGAAIDVCYRGHRQQIISEGYRKIPGDNCNEQIGFKPHSKFINLTSTCTGRITPSPVISTLETLKKIQPVSVASSNTLVITIVAIALIVLAIAVSFFGYKMVLLRRHKVVYRYSMLSQSESQNDDEIERTLTEQPYVFGDTSDEEQELPAEPYMNGHVKAETAEFHGYHDDSDDDMLK